ncbi:MAG: HAD-IIIC family phosphatase [Deltaproteobacteria bacterium]|nr:HAD-IIIC family phosphatase [Deltaproteobacteria bacterium]
MRSVTREPSAAVEAKEAVGPIRLVATFTADPVGEVLSFWMDELGERGGVELAGYNQVFQELLDPTSGMSMNRGGVNVVLVRLDDWLRYRGNNGGANGATQTAAEELVLRNSRELVEAVEKAARRTPTPIVFGVCADGPEITADPVLGPRFARIAQRLQDDLARVPNVHILEASDVARYPAVEVHDPVRNALGHIPYTPEHVAALGTALARKVHALRHPPAKVVVLDCDNTLWKGVVGEDGSEGISFDGGHALLQRFMVGLQARGTVLALVSKNVEQDVMEVFARRPEMPLKLEHLVAWRVNWKPKAENLASLAAELNVGLDAFVFLDDNPVECAEVRATHPEVCTLLVPPEPELARFIAHVWPLDVLEVTEEDRQRTAMYRQNAERTRFESNVSDISGFIEGLELSLDIAPPTAEQLPRISQLTLRTNQFNLTTVRRSEAEVKALMASGAEVLRCTVRDRFGDYGLVGVLMYRVGEDALEVDTFLLSCRVLGRGVEHALLRKLGEVARAAGKTRVDVPFAPTAKNEPAKNFVDSLGAEYREDTADGFLYRLPVEVAANASYTTGYQEQQLEVSRQRKVKAKVADSTKSQRYQRIATEITRPEEVVEALHARNLTQRPDTMGARVAPRSETERRLVTLWQRVLHVEPIGVTDRFMDLGGTSLASAYLFAEIERRWGRRFPLSTILEHDTVEKMARLLLTGERAPVRALPESVVPLRPGGSQISVFMVHDGFGETMLYYNLAQRLPATISVYGLEPKRSEYAGMVHTNIEDMANYYLGRIKQIQPEGPYFIAGLCAGGVLSFEMARQLEARGEEVGFVGIMDGAAPGTPQIRGRYARARMARVMTLLDRFDAQSPLRSAVTTVKAVAEKTVNMVRYEAGMAILQRTSNLRVRLAHQLAHMGVEDPTRVLAGLSVAEIYDLAEAAYGPQPLSAPVVLFKATTGEGHDLPHRAKFEAEDLGWGQWCEGGVEIIDVPGGHSSMLQDERAEVMAARIGQALVRTGAL